MTRYARQGFTPEVLRYLLYKQSAGPSASPARRLRRRAGGFGRSAVFPGRVEVDVLRKLKERIHDMYWKHGRITAQVLSDDFA